MEGHHRTRAARAGPSHRRERGRGQGTRCSAISRAIPNNYWDEEQRCHAVGGEKGGLAGGDGREVAWTCCHATLRGRAVDGAAAGWREGEGASDRTSMVGSLISAACPCALRL
jgi:hypothetical protein